MASGMYNRFKADLLNGEMDLEGDTVKVMLLDNSHSFSATDNVIGDISGNEISGTGYTAGGATLTSKAVTQGASTKWDAADIEWTTATFSAWHAGLYDDTQGTDDLICSIDFGGEKPVSAGTFKIKWHVNGIITLATAA